MEVGVKCQGHSWPSRWQRHSYRRWDVEVHVLVCNCYRVPRNEDLFYGNKAVRSGSDPDQNQPSFCLCDGSGKCGRRAVSDTSADDSEPQRNILLGVPKVFVLRRRRRRQTNDRDQDEEDVLTGNPRTYFTRYEYVILICNP